MKNKKQIIVGVIAVILALSLSIVSVQAYTGYRAQQDAKQMQREIDRALAYQHEQNKQSAMYARITDGCIAGQRLYELATPATRAKFAKPVCQ